jgi:IPT/TIG domain
MPPKARFAIIHFALLGLLAFPGTAARAQDAAKVCADGRTIKVASEWDQLTTTMDEAEAAAHPLRYSISNTQGVQGAWIEVWDRPKRLSRTRVSIQREGEAACAGCEDAGQTPDNLYISIFDPEVLSFCIDECGNAPRPSGTYVSEILAGKQPVEDSDESVEPAYLLDYPDLTGPPIRIEQGSRSTAVVLSGEDLIPSSRVYLVGQEDGSAPGNVSKDYLYSRTVDLRHVQVTLSAEFLEKPGVLTAYARDSWQGMVAEGPGTGQKIIVACKESPVIDSVEPKILRCCGPDASVVLRGSGFSKNSEAKIGDGTGPAAEVTFVSSSELRVLIPADDLEDSAGRYTRATPLALSVANDPLHYSDFVTLGVTPSAKLPREPLAAVIRAIAPYPVPMMDFHNSGFLTLEIEGDNFRPNDVVFINSEYGHSDRTRLKTQIVSSHHIRARLPRESWREHRLSFRFVVQTSAGLCAAEASAGSLE